jgi:hypothetical protein
LVRRRGRWLLVGGGGLTVALIGVLVPLALGASDVQVSPLSAARALPTPTLGARALTPPHGVGLSEASALSDEALALPSPEPSPTSEASSARGLVGWVGSSMASPLSRGLAGSRV